ncbi:zinc finger and BTB domain-containing protein 34, partial [Alosa pseudoharengus]|uniref:zinc finger and BTB domain-containing protein 34 n=1 Tax=Alosa pseudoharengus TaxID=34774 RepID=UPI003F8AE700
MSTMFVHLPQHQSSVQIEAVLITGETLGGAAGASGGAAGVAGGASAWAAVAAACEMEEAVAGGGYVELDVPEFSSGVLSQLNELRLQGKLCDIIVHVQGQPFRAHKAVLAASSPYFRDHSALGTMSGLSISVIKNPEVFEQLLAFCYTGRMALRLRDIVSFLTAASFLQMQAVIDKCTQILEGLHSKIHLPPGAIAMATDAAAALLHHHRAAASDEETSPPPPDEGSSGSSRARRNGVKDGGLFLNPTQISPPYYPRSRLPAGHASRSHLVHQGAAGLAQEEAQSDRGSSDGAASEQDASMEGETEQVELIGRDGQVTDVHVKLEKAERPSQSDSSSTTGDDGYHTELVDGEQVLAVSVGSYGPVLAAPPGGYSYAAAAAGLAAPCFLSLGSSPSPSRSLLGGFRGGRARSKRALPLPADVLSQLKGGAGAIEEAGDGSGQFEGDAREHSLRGGGGGQQWYPYNERLICIYCGKSFNQKGSLDRHMRLHMGITPFVCKFCGKKYTRKDQLEYHIRGHTDNKPFHCQLCGKCFPFQGTLNQHLRKKHMGAATPDGTANHGHSPEPLDGGGGGGGGGARAA